MSLGLDGQIGSQYDSTEIYGDEVATLVTSDSVYRETIYNVVLPYKRSLIDNAYAYMLQRDILNVNPLLFLRERIKVGFEQ